MKLVREGTIDTHIGVFNARALRRADLLMLVFFIGLAAIGIATLYSANRSLSADSPYYLRQLMFVPLGLVLALWVSCLDYRFLVSLAPVVYAVVVGLLVAVLLAGTVVKGAQRWLDLGPITLQPSEQSKLALIFVLAWYLGKCGDRIKQLHFFLLTFVIAALPVALILKQPNLGTAASLGPITIAMLYVAGCKRWHLAALLLLGAAALPVAWASMEDYQRQRVLTFMDPMADPKGAGYHTIQSMITVGSGGLTGKGYMQGTQTYLSYLPEHHTDFIFSLLAEEWGFMGAAAVVALYGAFLMRGLSFAQRSADLEGALLVVGIVTVLAFHVFINIAITLGLLPVTGIPLPFLSYGRSFYLTTALSVGVLLSVHVQSKLRRE